MEFGKACEDLSWNHCASTPHRSATDGIAERAVRRLKEGTSAVPSQSGLDENWWSDSMECHCYLRNIQDLLSNGKMPYERRFGVPFDGPVIPFGAMVEHHSISAEEMSSYISSVQKSCQVCSTDVRCTREESGEETLWTQTFEDLEQMDASEIFAEKNSMKRKC